MNNEKMDICKLIKNVFPTFPVFDRNKSAYTHNTYEYNSRIRTSVFIIHNTYDDELFSQNADSFTLRNRKTDRKYLVTKESLNNGRNIRINYLPDDINSNLYQPATEANAEAVAFSLSTEEIICFRVNSKGLFIEIFNLRDKKIDTEYYNYDAISAILSKDDVGVDNYKTLIEILNKLGVIGEPEFTPLCDARKKIALIPDLVIQCYPSNNEFVVDNIKNDILLDRFRFGNLDDKPFYSQYIYKMRDFGFYLDYTGPLRAKQQ